MAEILREFREFREFREAGTEEQFTVLAERAARKLSILPILSLDDLLSELRDGAPHLLSSLAARLPTAERFSDFLKIVDSPVRFRFGREPGGRPAHPWGWDDLD
ncbi:hypothetical protein [Streptomyces wedmorensis]